MAKSKPPKTPTPTNGAPSTPPSAFDVLTLAEAAAYLRLPEDAVRAEAEAGRLVGRHVRGEWRFARSGIVEWLRGEGGASREPGGRSSGRRILDFPATDETPEEQEAFLDLLREIRKSYGTVGGGEEAAT